MRKNKKWIKPRHRVVTEILRFILKPYCKLKYNITVERFKEQGSRAYLVLFNHQTPFDQFFVGMCFSGTIYYLATEDIFSNGFVSSLIRWLVAPIPIKKQTTDVSAVMNCLRVAKEGGTIALAPEGNRTYSGKTEFMNPAIGGLAKKMKLPIALCKIEGGYGAEPRWSDSVRKGKMRCFVSQVIEPEEYASLSADELFAKIKEGLFVDDSQSGTFKGPRRAEYLERAVYICPVCGLSEFESEKNIITCKRCGLSAEYGEDLNFTSSAEFPFKTVNDWYEYQKDYINSFDVCAHKGKPLYINPADVYEVIPNKKKVLLEKNDSVLLFGDRVDFCGLSFPFSQITAAAVLGRNKLNIYHNGKVYQFKGGKRFNALKYVHIYNRYKNITKGEEYGEFLGL